MNGLLQKIFNLFLRIYKKIWELSAIKGRRVCEICSSPTIVRNGCGRIFLECVNCGFVFTGDYPEFISNVGMGMVGSWGGAETGGEREDYLVRMLHDELGKNDFLLYGVGSTLSFPVLDSEGFNVYGCDLSRDVITYRQDKYGTNKFFHVNQLPVKKSKYDVVVACEVFEHFNKPNQWIPPILSSLKSGGILCGTTNFYFGGEIEDGQKTCYMSFKNHVAYWSDKSLAYILNKYGMKLILFEMICPGSVKPDVKYDDLFPNKRVFFATSNIEAIEYLEELKNKSPILPLDVSTYFHPAYLRN